MTSQRQKRALLYDKLQLLRSVTNSTALNMASIIIDASKYIEELKQKVEEMSSDQNIPVEVAVEALEKGSLSLINVFSEKSCPGLLVSVLEAFEDLGFDVLHARVSSSRCFQLAAIGVVQKEAVMDAQAVKHAVLKAVKKWTVHA